MPSPAINEVEPAKELKIEVHATAVHHEQLQPVVAHAQAHEISHEHAVSLVFLDGFFLGHCLGNFSFFWGNFLVNFSFFWYVWTTSKSFGNWEDVFDNFGYF